jgi:hypothetical protein
VAQGRGTGILEICTEWPGPWPEERRRTSAATVASSAKALLKNAEGKTWPVELEEIGGRVFLSTGWSKSL